jgi:hypothetical protein
MIGELRREAEHASHAGIVIRYPDRADFVWSFDPDPLKALNGHVEAGGEPVGLVAVTRTHTSPHAEIRPMREWAGDAEVEAYLPELRGHVERLAEKDPRFRQPH